MRSFCVGLTRYRHVTSKRYGGHKDAGPTACSSLKHVFLPKPFSPVPFTEATWRRPGRPRAAATPSLTLLCLNSNMMLLMSATPTDDAADECHAHR
ncbi:hypothetical protein EYF80_055080 [Liparis tanakae]|uniref:Uncharacterized protein n=1 Tax=Liparis tanakae TaxID=230148 RepID=A0A4Z2F156_9TELE|nr:hypothetical protein EYF80_055080 [Liparis tanakae]